MQLIHGIHHITAIAADPQKTVDFYTRILGLRLVKKSVNQDDVQTYHLFFGDRTGEPGMDLTFFTFQPTFPGQRGLGQVTTISLTVPEKSLVFWEQRFVDQHVKHEPITEKWGHPTLVFYDGDNQRLELVGLNSDSRQLPSNHIWTTTEINYDQAIRSFHSATLTMESQLLIEPILTQVFGYEVAEKKGSLKLYRLPDSFRAAFLEIEAEPNIEPGHTGAGTVHHIAFRVATEQDQLQVRESLLKIGLAPTHVIDRFYFKSVYFRTPAGILCEIATDGPGFTADESESELGQKLALPPFLESRRTEIEAGLLPLT